MKVQWTLSDGATAWAYGVAALGGMTPGAFCERLIRYHACALSENERQIFEHLLEVASNVVDPEFDEIEEDS